MMPMTEPRSCDLFCRVIDNFGDAGVCGRLARQFATEFNLHTRLWIDRPEVLAALNLPLADNWQVLAWPDDSIDYQPAELVIEAFGCELPPACLQAMADRRPQPVWLNLEYLSAEDWTLACHGLPSPHPRLPLRRYFYFPGFSTGGLIRERDLLKQRDAFRLNPQAVDNFLDKLGVNLSSSIERLGVRPLLISLFAYENPQLPALLAAWATGAEPVLVLVPQGRVLASLAEGLRALGLPISDETLRPGAFLQQGALQLRVLPFLSQPDYDRLLWACDLNFVRGEDSLVRGLWAGVPLVWHIYQQAEQAHVDKLEAMLARFIAAFEPSAAAALASLWRAWNAAQADSAAMTAAWLACRAVWPELAAAAARLCAECAQAPDLANRLLQFCAHSRLG